LIMEANAFLAIFTVQILAMSVLYPTRFIGFVRGQTASFPAERLAQLYPGVDLKLAQERFLARYRAVNTGIAVLGLLLLGWFFNYTQRSGWNEDPVVLLLSAYFAMQMFPIAFVAWAGFRFNKLHKRSLHDRKRKANLERRGLFDFVSPVSVFIAGFGYFFFVAITIYVQRDPFPGFTLIGVLTLVYLFQALVVYSALHGKKSNPLQTHVERVHTIGQTVKVCVYSCILCVVFFAFAFTVDLLEMKRWVPFAQSVCLLITTLLCLMSLTAPPRATEVDEIRSSPVR
jgi:MFS family permease